jgi:hypothetical protein
MGAISSFVEVLSKVLGTARIVANIGRPQLVKQLNALCLNLEQFRQALRIDDVSKMRELSAECEAESEMLERRLFKALDNEINASLIKRVRRVRASKMAMTRSISSKVATAKKQAEKREQSKNRQELKKAVKAKKASLLSAISTHDDTERDELLAEIESAIGTLRGLAKSLDSLSV